jgi:hypothetical protein
LDCTSIAHTRVLAEIQITPTFNFFKTKRGIFLLSTLSLSHRPKILAALRWQRRKRDACRLTAHRTAGCWQPLSAAKLPFFACSLFFFAFPLSPRKWSRHLLLQGNSLSKTVVSITGNLEECDSKDSMASWVAILDGAVRDFSFIAPWSLIYSYHIQFLGM